MKTKQAILKDFRKIVITPRGKSYILYKDQKIIADRSLSICQECYDKRSQRNLIYTDKIVPKDKCALRSTHESNLPHT